MIKCLISIHTLIPSPVSPSPMTKNVFCILVVLQGYFNRINFREIKFLEQKKSRNFLDLTSRIRVLKNFERAIPSQTISRVLFSRKEWKFAKPRNLISRKSILLKKYLLWFKARNLAGIEFTNEIFFVPAMPNLA